MACSGGRCPPRSARGRQPALDEGEDDVDPDREGRDEDGAGVDRRVVPIRPGACPSKMNRPSPPPDRIAPIVAVAMTWSVAVRKPPTMIERRERQLDAAQDLALADAHPAAGLDQVPIDLAQAGVGRRRESAGSRGSVIARKIGRKSRPNVGVVAEDRGEGQSVNGSGMTIIAYDGIARPMLARLIARLAPRLVWPMYSPSGTATIVASRTTRPEMIRCSRSRFGMPVVPCQLAGSRSNSTMSHQATAARAWAHGVTTALEPDEAGSRP